MAKKEAKKEATTKDTVIGCLIMVVMLAGIVAYCAPGLVGLSSSPPPATQNTIKTTPDRGNMAFIQCQAHVTQRLTSPASADFPFLDFTAVRDGGPNQYRVRSYVDSQNAFGAVLRTNFNCLIRYNSGDDADPRSWTLVNLAMS